MTELPPWFATNTSSPATAMASGPLNPCPSTWTSGRAEPPPARAYEVGLSAPKLATKIVASGVAAAAGEVPKAVLASTPATRAALLTRPGCRGRLAVATGTGYERRRAAVGILGSFAVQDRMAGIAVMKNASTSEILQRSPPCRPNVQETINHSGFLVWSTVRGIPLKAPAGGTPNSPDHAANSCLEGCRDGSQRFTALATTRPVSLLASLVRPAYPAAQI